MRNIQPDATDVRAGLPRRLSGALCREVREVVEYRLANGGDARNIAALHAET